MAKKRAAVMQQLDADIPPMPEPTPGLHEVYMAPPHPPLPAWVRRMTALFAIAVGLLFFFVFFNAFATVILGVMAAAIVACVLDPLRRRIPGPRGLAAAMIGVGLVAVVAALVLALSLPLAKPVKQQFENWPQSKASIDELLKSWSNRAHLENPLSIDELLGNLGSFFVTDRASLLLAGVRDAVLGILLWLAFVFVGSIFLLSSPREVLLGPVLRAIPPPHRHTFREMLDALGSRLRWWMIGTFGGVCIVFTASAIGYSAIGLKFALPLALLAGIAEIAPTVGPATAAVVISLFAASQSSTAMIAVIITVSIIQAMEAYVVLPLIMKGAVKIHPAVTLFSVILWAKIFGVPGLILAIPINLTIGSAVEYFYVRPREQRDAAARNAAAQLLD